MTVISFFLARYDYHSFAHVFFFKVVFRGKVMTLAEVLTISLFSLQPTMSFPVLSIYRLTMGHGGKPWVSNFNDPNYLAGRAAMKRGR